MNYRILNTIGDIYTKEAGNILDQIGKVDYLKLTREELKKNIDKYDILLVGLEEVIDKEIIEKGKNLKIIATPTTGLDHIDLEFAKSKNIAVLSLKGEEEFLKKITSTAELAFGFVIILLRKVIPAYESVKRTEWQRENFRGDSLQGKTLGILGLGRLGRMMVEYADAFGMQVIACDPYLEDSIFNELGCKEVSFDELLKESDVISVHVHLNKETEGIFNKESLGRMKPTAFLVNTSRGKIVNEKDLLDALKDKKIAGYGADVLAGELEFSEKGNSHPLIDYAKDNHNVVILPHIGGMTRQSREMTDIFIAQKIKEYINNRK